MRIKHACCLLLTLTIICLQAATLYAAPKTEEKKSWTIPFMGTMQVPAQLEVVDGKDVVLSLLRFSEKMEEQRPNKAKLGTQRQISTEDIEKAFAQVQIGAYELALKNNGTYNIAFLVAAKVPKEMTVMSGELFDTVKKADSEKQAEMYNQFTNAMELLYIQSPELKDVLLLEVLEFYPFERLKNRKTEVVSFGGSLAVRTFKLVQPFAFKMYIVKNNADFYVLALMTPGPERKLWNDMTKEMISKVKFSTEI